VVSCVRNPAVIQRLAEFMTPCIAVDEQGCGVRRRGFARNGALRRFPLR
jgi:hypothetical protein